MKKCPGNWWFAFFFWNSLFGFGDWSFRSPGCTGMIVLDSDYKIPHNPKYSSILDLTMCHLVSLSIFIHVNCQQPEGMGLLLRSYGRCGLFTWSLLGCGLQCICKVGFLIFTRLEWIFKASGTNKQKVCKMVFLVKYMASFVSFLVLSKVLGGQERSEH